ncbi:hypothetical protein ABZW18_13740 [Streptomyces sp. NPDC004647]|uniref:hypothetical protein n=1 Tax=Streptomyces sp. NPDC004647 TaxID=3154671 RepID=UPI0033B84942
MTRLIPLILIGLCVYFWLKTRKSAASLAERWMPERNAEPGGGSPAVEPALRQQDQHETDRQGSGARAPDDRV